MTYLLVFEFFDDRLINVALTKKFQNLQKDEHPFLSEMDTASLI